MCKERLFAAVNSFLGEVKGSEEKATTRSQWLNEMKGSKADPRFAFYGQSEFSVVQNWVIIRVD